MKEQKNYISQELKNNYPVPEKLEPENVEKMLEATSRSRIKLRTRIISSAAAVAVAAGAICYVGFNSLSNKENSKIKTDTKSGTSTTTTQNGDVKIPEETPEPANNNRIEGIKTMSYAELNRYIYKTREEAEKNRKYDVVYEAEDMTEEAAPATDNADTIANDGSKAGSGSDSKDHSETYEQFEGVSESDIVKTDGDKIFYTTNGQLFAFKADQGVLDKVNIDFTALINDGFEISNVSDLYLTGDTLTVVVSGENRYYFRNYYVEEDSDQIKTEDIDRELPSVSVISFDVSDIYNISEISRYTQQGRYIESRMIGSDIYISTYTGVYYYGYDFDDFTTEKYAPDFVPVYSVNGEKCYFPAEDIIVNEQNPSCDGYTIVSAFNVDSGERISGKAKLGAYANIYMTSDRLYMFNDVYDESEDYYYWNEKTQFTSFDITDGNITPTGNTFVEGSVNNRFWLGMVGDTFCAAVHDDDYSNERKINNLYTFEKDLRPLGVSEGFGEGEEIKSVTYRDNCAYVVTFIQTDPLFAIDVSDPANPTIVSELKMPGFSTHLRAFSDGRMIGFGQTADESTGRVTGLKLSMYDTSDQSNVRELSNVELSSQYNDWWNDYNYTDDIYYYDNYYSPANYDEKALLIDAEKNIIAFPFSYYYEVYNDIDYTCTWETESGVKFYTYSDETGFVEVGSYSNKNSGNEDSWDYIVNDFYRTIYIEDVLYLFGTRSVVSVSMNDYSVISEYSLEEFLNNYNWYWYDDVIIE